LQYLVASSDGVGKGFVTKNLSGTALTLSDGFVQPPSPFACFVYLALMHFDVPGLLLSIGLEVLGSFLVVP
jgi:hypothetical protein